jgi:predicted enzyme related to lactoylglutathione lyase
LHDRLAIFLEKKGQARCAERNTIGGKRLSCVHISQYPNDCGAALTGGAFMEDKQIARKDANMQRVIHFEIYTDDPEAVQPFYEEVFGWRFEKFEGGPFEYWVVRTGNDKDPGINGGLTSPREGQHPGTINTIAVPSLDRSIKKIEESGGKICVPKMQIPNVGWLAYAEDPAGNIFGVIQPAPQVKRTNGKVRREVAASFR